jgi:hypothetical protein
MVPTLFAAMGNTALAMALLYIMIPRPWPSCRTVAAATEIRARAI